MPEFCGPYVYTTTHEFKGGIARWTRLLERGVYRGIFITRHGIPVAVYMTQGVRAMEEKLRDTVGPRLKNDPNQIDS